VFFLDCSADEKLQKISFREISVDKNEVWDIISNVVGALYSFSLHADTNKEKKTHNKSLTDSLLYPSLRCSELDLC